MSHQSLKFGVVVGLAFVFFAGCSMLPSVGPSYEESDYLVEDFRLPDAGFPTSNLTVTCEYEAASTNCDRRIIISTDTTALWWKQFNDPVLEQLVDNLITNNLDFQMTLRRLDQANYELLGSYAAFLPKFTAGADWMRHWYHRDTPSGGGNNLKYNYQGAVLDGQWEIDLFGGSRRATEAAIARAEAAGWTVADAWLNLTSDIGREYISLRTIQDRIDVARTNLVLQSETYDILKSRLDSGIGDELAVNQCSYIVEQTRARIPQLLAEEEALKNALAILAGDAPGALHEDLQPLTMPRDWLLAPQRVAELPFDLVRSRPDVKEAERELAAATAEIGVEKAQWFPRLFINGQVGYGNQNSARLFSKDSFLASLGPSISWPIFQGGAIYASVKAAEARMEEKALAYELAIDNAYREIRNAYSAYTQEYHRYQSLKGAVKAATDAVSISQDLYQNGLRDFNNVLDAQRSRLELEEQLVISRGQITLNLIDLYQALGGGLAKGE